MSDTDDLYFTFELTNEDNINAEFELTDSPQVDAIFEINAAGTTWGSIDGDITNQTDLMAALDLKANVSDVNTEFGNVYTTIENNYTTLDNKIDTVQLDLSGDISALSGTVEGYNTALNNRIDATNTTVSNNFLTLNGKINTNTNNIASLNDTVSNNYTTLDGKITTINNALSDYGDIVTHNVAEFATAAQGGLADTALQPNDNISELNNNVGYITLSSVKDSTITIQKNSTDVGSFTLNQSSNEIINISVPTDTSDLTNGAGFITSAALPTLEDLATTAQLAAINSGATTTNIGQIATNATDIGNEVTNRQNADNALQSQIDAIVASSDVFDIVGTYAELQAYDITTVPANDIIKVLVDSTHNNAATYYRCVENDNVKSWSYIGSEGAYYTKGEADSRFVAQTITVNGQALSSNVTLTASDVGALPSSTTIGAGVLTVQKNGTTIDTFGANDTGNTTINISVPTDTSDLTNGAGYITSNELPTLSDLATNTQMAAIDSGATAEKIGQINTNTGDISNEITNRQLADSDLQSQITAISNNYVTTDTDQNITGTKTFVGDKRIKFKQAASNNKLGFTLYDNNNNEKGYLEFNPSNTIDNAPLMTLGNYATSTSSIAQVGFRRYSSVSGANGAYNLLTPLIADAKTPFNLTTTYTNFYLPLGFTDGVTTVTTAKSGLVDLSSILPNSAVWGNITGTLSNQTDLSNALSDKQDTLVSGTNIKTVNNTSLLGSGDITIDSLPSQTGNSGKFLTTDGTDASWATVNADNIFWATYGTTTYSDIISAINADKLVLCIDTTGGYDITYVYRSHTSSGITFYNCYSSGIDLASVSSSNVWDTYTFTAQEALVSGTNIKTINSNSLLGTGDISVLQNRGSISHYSLGILGSSDNSVNDGTWVGASSQAVNCSAAFGMSAKATGQYATAVGWNAIASGQASIQIGYGTNSTSSTMAVGFEYLDGSTVKSRNWTLLNGTTGLIPDERISSNIARTSALPSLATTSTAGIVQPDGSTITVNNGVISATPARNIGEIVQSTIPLTDAGLHLLDGSLISGSGSYADFVTYIAGLVNDYPNLFETEANWQTSVTTYGVCGKFVYDSVNNTVRLPKITGIIEGTIDATALGDLVQAGLPNITGSFGTYIRSLNGSGAFTTPTQEAANTNQTDTVILNNHSPITYFNASRSSSIYGNSSTVQPQTIKAFIYIVIATSAKTEIQVDIDEIATDLNGKADTDLTNLNNTGKIAIAHNAMPSNTYVDLTAGASGTVYTMPSVGWLCIGFQHPDNADWINYGVDILDSTGQQFIWNIQGTRALSNQTDGVVVPVAENQKVRIFQNSYIINRLRFIYAQGSESEAQ